MNAHKSHLQDFHMKLVGFQEKRRAEGEIFCYDIESADFFQSRP